MKKFKEGMNLDWLITRSFPLREDIEKRAQKGWKYVTTVPAKTIHPYASESDYATIFSHYEPYKPNENALSNSNG